MLTRIQKQNIVKELKESLQASEIIVLLDYKGLSVRQISAFRDQLREKGGVLRIAKNTLLRIALKESGYTDATFHEKIQGTNAVLYVKKEGDASSVLRSFVKFSKDQPFIVPKAIVFDGAIYEGKQVGELSKLPSRTELYAMLCNRMQAPISKFVFSLNGILTKVVYALEAIKEKKSKTE